jgi:hypothetical protein
MSSNNTNTKRRISFILLEYVYNPITYIKQKLHGQHVHSIGRSTLQLGCSTPCQYLYFVIIKLQNM